MPISPESLVSNFGFAPDNRLVAAIADDEHTPIRTEVVPNHGGEEDELSGNYYNDRALFYADGTIEIVSYKGEGEGSFENEHEYRGWLESREMYAYDPEDDYDYE